MKQHVKNANTPIIIPAIWPSVRPFLGATDAGRYW
jgi:hypothetical protein